MSGSKLKKAVDKKDVKAVESILRKPKHDGNALTIKGVKGNTKKWSNEVFDCTYNVLGYAISKKLDEMVTQLLTNPFLDVDAICFEQDFPKSGGRNLMSPIMFCIYRSNAALVEFLVVKCHADLHKASWMDGPSIKPAGEISPLEFARKYRPEMYDVIKKLIPGAPVEISEMAPGENGTIRYTEQRSPRSK